MKTTKTMTERHRNYKDEYKRYHGKPRQRHERSLRNQARAMLKEAGRITKKRQEADHRRSLKNGGSNKLSNLQVLSRHANRVKGSHNSRRRRMKKK